MAVSLENAARVEGETACGIHRLSTAVFSPARPLLLSPGLQHDSLFAFVAS
jgi:hypothetical protein